MSFLNDAKAKIAEGMKAVKGNKESAMKSAVAAALEEFCSQDDEPAEAVTRGDFAECMKAVAKGVGNSISDLEAYQKAVTHYLPDRKIRYQMVIEGPEKKLTQDSAAETEKPSRKVIDLSELL